MSVSFDGDIVPDPDATPPGKNNLMIAYPFFSTSCGLVKRGFCIDALQDELKLT
jgi:hypothetical protein